METDHTTIEIEQQEKREERLNPIQEGKETGTTHGSGIYDTRSQLTSQRAYRHNKGVTGIIFMMERLAKN